MDIHNPIMHMYISNSITDIINSIMDKKKNNYVYP